MFVWQVYLFLFFLNLNTEPTPNFETVPHSRQQIVGMQHRDILTEVFGWLGLADRRTVAAAYALGQQAWETVEADFPGRDDMRLVQATRVEINKA